MSAMSALFAEGFKPEDRNKFIGEKILISGDWRAYLGSHFQNWISEDDGHSSSRISTLGN